MLGTSSETAVNNMKYKSQIELGIKIVFLLLEALIFMAGFSTLIIFINIFIRANQFLKISDTSILLPLTLSVLFLVNGTLGYLTSINKKRRSFFFFILTLLALMNLQIILIIKADRFVDTNKFWLNKQWSFMTDDQKKFFQESLRCCGLETLTDRSTPGCHHNKTCSSQLSYLAIALKTYVQFYLISMFFVESISLCLISFLRFGK